MLLTIIISVIISVIATIGIVIFALKIYSSFLVKFISETEDRFDQKINLKRELQKHNISK